MSGKERDSKFEKHLIMKPLGYTTKPPKKKEEPAAVVDQNTTPSAPVEGILEFGGTADPFREKVKKECIKAATARNVLVSDVIANVMMISAFYASIREQTIATIKDLNLDEYETEHIVRAGVVLAEIMHQSEIGDEVQNWANVCEQLALLISEENPNTDDLKKFLLGQE